MLANKSRVIIKTKAEVQSGFDRQRAAEGLILQLPSDHDGRNTWLLNYGVSAEADKIRSRHPKPCGWDEKRNACHSA